MKQEQSKRIRRLLKIILEVKTSPQRSVPGLIKDLGISKSQFYKDKDTC